MTAARRAELLQVVADHAGRRPDAPALLDPSAETLSYGELRTALLDVIAQLRVAGIGVNDRVVVAAAGDVLGAVLSLAMLGAAVCVPVSGAWSPEELRQYLEIVGPRAVVAAGADTRRATDAAHALGVRAFELDRSMTLRETPPAAGAVPPEGRLSTDPGDALLLRTSGTTAAGKVVALTMPQLLAAARASVRAYHLGTADRRLNAMPLFHVQGLVGSLAASMCAGGSIAFVPRFEAAAVLRALRSCAPTWFSATPTMHRALLDAMPAGFETPPTLRFVRCGSGALPASLRAEMERRWRIPVVESYGMSEAHQIASTPVPPSPAASGMVPSGSTIGVLGDDGVVRVTPGEPGELVIRGENVSARYAWPPGLEMAFTDGWLRTGDAGELAPDGSVRITGRIKELIDCGGEKFSPAEVEAAIAAHPAVQDVVAFALPDPLYGECAGAIVVPRPGHRVDERDLLSFAARRVAPAKVPRRIVQMEAIPVGEAGKVVRSELAKRVAADRPPRAGTRPRGAVEATLAGLWATALDRETVGVDDDFVVVGGDSLSAVTLLSMVNDIFGVEISPLMLFDEVTTIASMARWIEAARAPAPTTAGA